MQGLLLEVIQNAAPDAYAKRTKRQGIVNAWMDKNFAQAVRDTGGFITILHGDKHVLISSFVGKRNLIVAGVTTDVCLVPPALSMQGEGFTLKVGVLVLQRVAAY
jgi:hypothetical protein